LFNPAQRARIQQRFAAALDDHTAPLTIIAHSLGSVIAYDGLAALAPRSQRAVQLITLGSPLGLAEVQDFLAPPGQKVPAALTQWHNFSDPLDPVALDAGLSGDFVPSGFIRDQRIVNTRSRSLLELDPHSAVGYLAHASVRRVVHDLLRMDPMARFVLARDVAELLGTEPQLRHPVLIEVLEPGYSALDETPERTRQREHRTATANATLKAAAPEKGHASAPAPLQLADRVVQVAAQLETLVSDKAAARIDPLQRFVAAHLTAEELRTVAAAHRELRVYAVWRSSRKAKLTARSLQTLKADAALASFGAAGQGITWAVLDTGLRADHPHFKAANDGNGSLIDAVWDCTQPGKPVSIAKAQDPDGHGTHVAGIISGKEAAGPHRGVAPRATLVVYKVLDDQGEGEDAWIIKALDHIAQRNANSGATVQVHGINLSLGGPFDATVYGCGFSPICAELRRQWRDGVLVVVACGNEGQLQVQTAGGEVDLNTAMSIGDPANLEDCIAVGSVHADKPHLYGVSSFSSRGPTADGRPKPDVVAPGERISSCNASFHAGKGDLYRVESGTSMAAPHVSGLLAAFLSVRREFIGRPDDVKRILLDACNDLGRDRYHQGRGLPNLMQMLLSV
jgi:subtilisin family serine protease